MEDQNEQVTQHKINPQTFYRRFKIYQTRCLNEVHMHYYYSRLITKHDYSLPETNCENCVCVKVYKYFFF